MSYVHKKLKLMLNMHSSHVCFKMKTKQHG